jgi:hypothetical protein
MAVGSFRLPSGVKSVFLRGNFAATNDTLINITIDADSAGSYTTLTQDGSSGTITIRINSVITALPFTLTVGDIVGVTRTSFASAGFYKISGTYV